jgi:demethylmenaquinone methyltransferase/2-methoxy-6-polyprenyl-1,4-benzoquinol methylase
VSPEEPRGTLPEGQVRAMFDRISGIYDLLNQVMTVGLHHKWRARAADLAEARPGAKVLDVACGTGDLAIELARRGCDVIGSDFSEEMLVHAREKDAARSQGPASGGHVAAFGTLTWEWANAMELPYEDDRFDAATVGFGARNFSDLPRGVGEMARVVRPGGKVVILEITTPTRPPLSTFFRVWFDRIVPLLGRVAGDSDAYEYLPSSVKRFPAPEGLAAVMAGAGLRDIRWILTAGGIIAIHVGTV